MPNVRKFKPINQQTIVITGASSGIGLATAIIACVRGANVVICSRNEDDLNDIANKLSSRKGTVLPVRADVTQIGDLQKVASEAIAEFGSIDTWVNNAGSSIYGPLLEIPEDQERQLFENNFWGVRHGCHVAVAAMKVNGGVIINMGSEVSARSIPLQGMYSASKHAVKAYTDALRMELEHDHIPIAVSLIRPTAIDTPFTEHAVNELRIGEPSLPSPAYPPEEVAEAILSCAVDPKRDIFVGGQSKLALLLDTFAPRLADQIYGLRAFDEQVKGTKFAHSRENEGLYSAPQKEGKLRGGHKGKIKDKAQQSSQRL